MKYEINSKEHLILMMGLHCYKDGLKNDLKNKARYLTDWNGNISEKTRNEMNTAIRNIDVLMAKMNNEQKVEWKKQEVK